MIHINTSGNMTQSFGLGRAVGQIYAYLYFSEDPRNLADMQNALGISKGSASTNVRQLEQWGAVRKVWIKGDRKDYYEASDWFGRILKNALMETVGKKMTAYSNLLEDVEEMAAGLDDDKDAVFVKERLEQMKEFQKRTQKIWESHFLKKLLK